MRIQRRFIQVPLLIAIFIGSVLTGVAGYAIMHKSPVPASPSQDEKTDNSSMQPFFAGSPFHYTPSGDVYIVKYDCEYNEGDPMHPEYRYITTKMDGINASDVETVGRQFIRVKAKLYDGFYPEFKKRGIEKTNNIGNPVDVDTFKSIDDENEYFQDKNGLYFYHRYPTINACLRPSLNGIYSSPIVFETITLQSPDEIQLYRGQKNNIFVPRYGRASYTPYAKLNGSLYWQNADGQFTKIPGTNPENFRLLSETMLPSDLYTDGKYVFLHGKITEIYPTTFHEITFTRNGSGEQLVSNFFKANSRIYYLSDPQFISDSKLSIITKTDADPMTFEVIDTNGSYVGRIYRDKDYVYSIKRDTETETVERVPK